MDQKFEEIAGRDVDQFPALSPVAATRLGDPRFDGQLDQVGPAARQREAAFCRQFLDQLAAIDPDRLSRANQVDRAMLEHHLRADLWRLETLQEWAWNPLRYTGLASDFQGRIYLTESPWLTQRKRKSSL